MPSFTPPTVKQPIGTGPLLSRFNLDVGQAVVKKGGVYTVTPYPWIGELEAAGDEGTDWFLGGRTYVVTDAVGTALTDDGFTVVADEGYGEGDYGNQGFGY